MWASPIDIEWLARLVAISLMQGWSGALLCSTDAAATMFRSHTTRPPSYTVLEALWRALSPVLLRLRPFHEVWTPAQHDTRATHLLATLNAAAHALATTGWVVPLAPLLCPRMLLYYMGALVLDPHKGLDAAYDQAATDAYFARPHQDLLRPAVGEFSALVENAAVPALAVKRAYAYRVLEWQSPPDRQLPMECHFCG